MINPSHLRQLIVRPTLTDMNMWSPAAENLVMGTAAAESHCGRHLIQLGNGPAVGIYQVEPSTAHDVVYRYLEKRPDLDHRFQSAFQLVNSHLIDWDEVNQDAVRLKLLSDLRFSTAVCRLRYWMVPEALPSADDVEGLARYWKEHYNTHKGRGSIHHFIKKYQLVVPK